jgi:internalin A
VGSRGRGLFFETENFDPTNQIKELPPSIMGLTNLEELDLTGNPISIPPEVLEKTNEPSAILTYYFYPLVGKLEGLGKALGIEKPVWYTTLYELKLGYRPLNELKILLVGQGSVGKTSLVQQILHGTFDQDQTKTEGISINQWQVTGSEKREIKGQYQIINPKSELKLNIWDFGGQEIMHATHQFFLTKRSLYLLVLNARQTQEENRVEYWLKIIQSFGGDSPVIIVGNQVDEHPFDIDKTGLQKKYPNIVGIIETSAKTGAGIETLKAEIAKQVDTMPHVRDLLPETWFTVKSKLEELGRNKNFITQDEYLGLCDTHDVTDETSQHTLIGFLHDLGVVLHFQDDPRLEALGILNPQWVTNGVYKILNSHELFQNQGMLTLPMLNRILNLPEYPSNKRLFIVDMMKKFELCYDIESDKSFLVPDLLPKDEIYTGEWQDALAFQVHYNVLPSSIITRFIVRMNAFIHKNAIWRSGVVLKRGDNTALVKADTEDRKIYIWVSGNEDTRRDLLAMIRGEFDAIHKTIIKIEATEKVPLPNAPEADPVDLTFLQQLASEGRESLPVQVGNRIIDLIVKEALSQIEKEGKTPSPNYVVNVQGNFYGSVGDKNTVNFIQQKFEPIYEAIEASSRDATEKQDLVAEVDEIKDEVAKGEQANESFLSRRLRNLKKMAPDIADVALSTLANPAAGLGMIVQKVAKKIKDETK